MSHDSAFAVPAARREAQTLVAYLEDRPGALNRVVSLFRRRGFNIDSLTVGRTERPGLSRVTVVVQADDDTARRLEANLYKLVDVTHVEDLTHAPAVVRELALIKVRAEPERRAELLQLCGTFRARVVDVATDSLMVEATGTQEKLDGLVTILRPFGVLEMVRTGAIAMARSNQPTLFPEATEAP
ncbi:MAG TPA: acetolactate synthase small subunit [Myxococcales bacterium]|nr:acetolactate synthase small subunit [Myxococcales bacterium]